MTETNASHVDLAPVPDARLGELLRQARERAGVAPSELADRLSLSHTLIQQWEDGRTRPDDTQVTAIATALGMGLADIVPPRERLAEPTGTADEQIATFVRLVSALRQTEPGNEIQFRSEDLAVLAISLGTAASDIEARIVALTSCTRAEATVLRRQLVKARLLVPIAAGAFAVASILGGATPAAAADGAPAPVTDVVEVDTLKARITALEGQVATLQNENATLTSQRDAADARNAELSAALDEARAKLAAPDTTVDTLRAELAAVVTERDNLRGQLVEAQEQIRRQGVRLTTARETVATQELEIGRQTEQVTALTAELTTVRETVATQELEIGRQAEQITTLTADLDAAEVRIRRQGSRLTTARATISTQEAEIGRQTKQITTLTADLDEARTTIAARDEQSAALTVELNEIRAKIATSEKEVASLAVELDNARTTIASQRDETAKADTRISSLTNQLTSIEANLAQRTLDLDAAQADRIRLSAELDSTRSVITSLQDELGAAQRSLEVAEAKAGNNESAAIKALERNLAQLEAQTRARATRIGNLERRLSTLQATATRRADRIEVLTSRSDRAAAETATLRKELNDIRNLLASIRRDLRGLGVPEVSDRIATTNRQTRTVVVKLDRLTELLAGADPARAMSEIPPSPTRSSTQKPMLPHTAV